MRFTIIGLCLMGVVLLAVAGVLAAREQDFRRRSVTAPGVVSMLNEGPYHAEVSVRAADGHRFDYVENSSERPLAVGEALTVRYDRSNPEATARVERGGANLPLEFAGAGFLMILAALASPLLVRTFPGLFTFAIRP